MVINENRTGCIQCPKGTRASSGKCVMCSEGRFHDGINPNNVCSTCPVGMTNNTDHSECILCPPGTKGNRFGKCTTCAEGKNVEARGAHECVSTGHPCSKGFFQDRNGACVKCNPGTKYLARSNTCVQCPSHMISPGGDKRSAQCKRCPANKVPDSRQTNCGCRAGWYELANGRCRKCGSGREFVYHSSFDYFEVIDADAMSCNRCRPGTFSNDTSAGCEICPPGLEPNEKQTGCKTCAPGLRSFSLGGAYKSQRCVDPRTNCPPGEERQTEKGKLVRCGPSKCLPGEHLDKSAGVSRCVKCRDGERFRPNEFGNNDPGYCASCPKGKVNADGTECLRCAGYDLLAMPNGSGYRCGCRSHAFITGFSAYSENGCLETCPDGTGYVGSRSPYKDDRCEACPPGCYGPVVYGPFDFPICARCPRGEFSDKPGSGICQKCPPGQTNNIDRTGCVESEEHVLIRLEI